MLLSDRDIEKKLVSGEIRVLPKPDLTIQLGSCSLDLRLGSNFRVFNYSKVPFVDPLRNSDAETTTEIHVKDGESFILHPGDFALAVTKESILLPDDLVGRLEGRSSLGRLGIVVHSTASIIDPGFSGVIVMELGNLGRAPVALYPGMRICAVTFELLTTPSSNPYNKKKKAKYINQSEPLESKIVEEIS